MRNLPGAPHASKSHLVLEALENRLTPAISALNSTGVLSNLSALHTAAHLVNSQLGVVSDTLTTQVSDVIQTITAAAQPLLPSAESSAAALVSMANTTAQPLAAAIHGAGSDATGLTSTESPWVPLSTKTVASLAQLNGTRLAPLPSSLIPREVGTTFVQSPVPAQFLASVATLPSGQSVADSAGSMTSGSLGQTWLDGSTTWRGGSDGFSEVAEPQLSYSYLAETGDTSKVRVDSGTAGIADDAVLQAESLPMTAALVVNRLEAAASAAAKQLADTLNAEIAWLGTVHPSVWLMCAVFVIMSHEYFTRRRAKGLWPDGGTPWSTALADVVPAR